MSPHLGSGLTPGCDRAVQIPEIALVKRVPSRVSFLVDRTRSGDAVGDQVTQIVGTDGTVQLGN